MKAGVISKKALYSIDRNTLTNFNPRIFACSLSGSGVAPESLDPTRCQGFYRTFSNYGLAYTFNGESSDKLHAENTFNQFEIFNMKHSKKSGSWHYVENKSGRTSGTLLQMTLQQAEQHPARGFVEDEEHFRVSFHDPMSVANLR